MNHIANGEKIQSVDKGIIKQVITFFRSAMKSMASFRD
jgi:hypothetical protein